MKQDNKARVLVIWSIITIIAVFIVCLSVLRDKPGKNTVTDVLSGNPSDYETKYDMPILEHTNEDSGYYEREWNIKDGFDGFTSVSTTVNLGAVNDEDNKAGYMITVSADEDKRRIVIESNGNVSAKYKADIRLFGNGIYALINGEDVSDHTSTFCGYVYSDYDKNNTKCRLSDITKPYDAISDYIGKSDYAITYNLKTKLDDTEVDDITVMFDKKDGVRLFVDSSTHKVKKIISPLVCDSDESVIGYWEEKVDKFKAKDVADAEPYGDCKLKKLPDGTTGSNIGDEGMATALPMMCSICSYNMMNLDWPLEDLEK